MKKKGFMWSWKDDNVVVYAAADGDISMNWAYTYATHCALHNYFI